MKREAGFNSGAGAKGLLAQEEWNEFQEWRQKQKDAKEQALLRLKRPDEYKKQLREKKKRKKQ